MSAILAATLKVVFLALMWLFILFVANTVRTDLFGRTATASDLTDTPGPTGARGAKRRRRRRDPSRLVVIAGRRTGLEAPLDGEISIGRSADCILDIDDDYASGHHAQLWQDSAGRWVITDLQSTNGTYVNGAKIAEPTLVGPNDVIRIGRSQLKLER
ncbi:FHA domain-containing protein [uncultured Propionibacterium sp.]|uniref:FHA domain-containing protein FhaB/FipA n=1 Tax=uncultured Propionibacterium sp. TaxID=218066 RepID=UPI0029314A57|nr:FHA domain-containing protein [uncultured Propionibacterium sp.]